MAQINLPFIRCSLLKWYDVNGRALPWRKNKKPYPIWLSEIMLQQTQVETVIPYFRRFLKTFPTVQSLAEASLQTVLKLWEGLGYYSRARNLHLAAKIIHSEYNNRFPRERALLEKLPGIGPSTAGAILSIAFNQREAILDGNVKRVLCRLFAIKENMKDPAVLKTLWKYSRDLLPSKRVSDFNQALMDLGATVCTPKTPQCSICPIQKGCEALAQRIQDTLPIRTVRKKLPHREFVIGIIQNKYSFLIQQRPQKGLLGGLWEFPTFESHEKFYPFLHLEKELWKQVGIKVEIEFPLNPIQHTYTHFKATYYPYLCKGRGTPIKTLPRKWVSISELIRFPTSRVHQKLIQIISPSSLTPHRQLELIPSFHH